VLAFEVAPFSALAAAIVARVEPGEIQVIGALREAVLAPQVVTVFTGIAPIFIVVTGMDAVRRAPVVTFFTGVILLIAVAPGRVEMPDLFKRVCRVIRAEERVKKLQGLC
jgi:tetrahydromethanopterin S-methyltransferase subunit C